MTTKDLTKTLVTCALPYANGPIHLGHMVEYIQADVWVRFQKLQQHDCLFICGEDAHGTPVMLSASKQGVSPDDLVTTMQAAHHEDFSNFLVEFDQFHNTHSEENKTLVEQCYEAIKAKGDIDVRSIEQAYDPEKNMFLPDRFVKGECPKCGAADQYGDNCEACGATYHPVDLINPVSVVSGATPIEKISEHYFFRLDQYETFLQDWIKNADLQPQAVNKLQEWFEQGLKQWDISRDKPYFGFLIPGTKDKYFYVWLDAPIGYMAALKKLTTIRHDIDFDAYWQKDSTAKLYHFIGKDVMYFHTLFWPAILKSAGYRTPTGVFVHGFLTVNGKKMSKSRGTFITAGNYLKELNPEYLRYYFAAKLSAQIEDIDLNWQDFIARVNSDLVGKYVNIASRCAGFIKKHFDGKLSDTLHDESLFAEISQGADDIATAYQAREFSTAVRSIMALADRTNQYIDQHQPWKLIKEDGQKDQVHLICTQGINLFRLLTIYLKPILPITAQRVEAFLSIEPLTWQDHQSPLLSHKIEPFKPLLQRITEDQLENLQVPSES